MQADPFMVAQQQQQQGGFGGMPGQMPGIQRQDSSPNPFGGGMAGGDMYGRPSPGVSPQPGFRPSPQQSPSPGLATQGQQWAQQQVNVNLNRGKNTVTPITNYNKLTQSGSQFTN